MASSQQLRNRWCHSWADLCQLACRPVWLGQSGLVCLDSSAHLHPALRAQ